MVDIAKLTIGAVVHVRMTVIHETMGNYVRVSEENKMTDDMSMYDYLDVKVANIVHVEPEPLKAGDVVIAKHSTLYGAKVKIIHTHDGWAWCEMIGGVQSRLFFDISDLTRVEE